MRTAYLDNSATTPVCGAAAEAARDAMLNHYGNPSSLHALGVEAEEIVDCSRRAIADRLSAQKKEILFTSCGTEANNLALMGAAGALRRRGKRIVISCVEHPSVARTADALEAQGYEIVRLPVGADGVVPESALAEAITSETIRQPSCWSTTKPERSSRWQRRAIIFAAAGHPRYCTAMRCRPLASFPFA